jgi:hypothetical protein
MTLRADYDSEGRTVAIELTDDEVLDYGDDSIGGAVVHMRHGHAVAIDLLRLG